MATTTPVEHHRFRRLAKAEHRKACLKQELLVEAENRKQQENLPLSNWGETFQKSWQPNGCRLFLF